MATATNEVERIVRQVLKEEQDETINAIQELSSLLTEQVLPKLSSGANGESEWDQDEDADQDEEQDDAMSLSSFDDDAPTSRRRKPVPNGRDDTDETDRPEREIPQAVLEAFTSMYHTLSDEQASALAEVFTTIESELDDETKSQQQEEDQDEESRVHV